MTEDKKSPEDPSAKRRKNDPKRLERATRDRERKRAKRGGFKSPSRAYQEGFAKLAPDEQVAARLLYESPQSVELSPSSFSAWPQLDPQSREVIFFPNLPGDLPTEHDSETGPKKGKNSKPLVMNANARARRREQRHDDYDREIVTVLARWEDAELEKWVSSLAGELDPKAIVARIKAQYAEALERLNARKKAKAEKAARWRDQNLDKVRPLEKQKTASRRAKEKEARERAPFVAIDAEGMDIGSPFELEAVDDQLSLDLGLPESASANRRLTAQDHRTFLWGASADGGDVDWLGGSNKTPLASKAILDWLVSLPKKFPGAIFAMFAAGYDWTQLFRDMPYERAWELWNGLLWEEHDNPTGEKPKGRRWVLWGEFALCLYPGKYVKIGKLKDPARIRDNKGRLNLAARIKIFDTFGFFQASFVKAAMGFGGNFLSSEELEILTDGKSRRTDFARMPLPEIMRYTRVELRVLARMMTKMREGLKDLDLKLANWHGAGCIAQAMMIKDQVANYYPENSANEDVDDFSDPLAWALRAYFGGRVEMIKQGVHKQQFWNCDISSAYPHILRQLPAMRNGEWRRVAGEELLTSGIPNNENSSMASGQPMIGGELDLYAISKFKRTQEDLLQLLMKLEEFSLVSMVRVIFHFPTCHRRVFKAGQWIITRSHLPWFPLPVRSEEGTIYFPRHGQGIYVVEEVRAMLRWALRIYADATEDERPIVALPEAIEFIPIQNALPFKARIEGDFARRAAIIAETEMAKEEWKSNGKSGPEPYDVREKVVKLGLNSIYGKTAQSKGLRLVEDANGVLRAVPPKLSNMFYAAAVTAGTRAMLLDAASVDPDAVILFATDGICATRELPGLEIPESKTLGTWERSSRKNGVFVKAGIYMHEPDEDAPSHDGSADKQGAKLIKRATKMRGICLSSLPKGMTAERWLIEAVPQAWGRDDPSLKFPYSAYKTVGAALASREAWKLAGHWIKGEREADIQRVAAKRDCRGLARSEARNGEVSPGERRRAIALFDTAPAENPLGYKLSLHYSPEWLDGELAKRAQAEDEQKTLECKGGFGFERD